MELCLIEVPENTSLGIWLSENDVGGDCTTPTSVPAREAENPDGPDFPSWVESNQKEQTKLIAHHCWKTLTPAEYDRV